VDRFGTVSFLDWEANRDPLKMDTQPQDQLILASGRSTNLKPRA